MFFVGLPRTELDSQVRTLRLGRFRIEQKKSKAT